MVTFSTFSYIEANSAKQGLKGQKPKYGSMKGKTHLTPKQEATIWTELVNHLSKEDRLPAVAFTLSRNRCDQNAENLTTVDLTSGSEKNLIHRFFNRSIQNLKEPDRALRQVKHTFMHFTVAKFYQLCKYTSLLNIVILLSYFCNFCLIFISVYSSFHCHKTFI
jgi:superfamily II RNA helicase